MTPPPAPAPAPMMADAPKFPTMAGPFLKINDIFSFRPGILLQLWAVGAQDSLKKANGDSGEFAKQIYMRRARAFLAGQVGKDVTWTVLWESSNIGQAAVNTDGATVTKGYTTPGLGAGVTFGIQDAYLDYRLNPNISIQAGLFLPPFTRNILQSTATYWAIDIGAVSATNIGVLQTNTLRDTGVELKVNALENRFEARAMVSQGVKLFDAAGRAPGKNDPRFTGFLQYNFFDGDTGYVFNGQYFGKKKIAGIALGGDYQDLVGANPYFATSATLFAAIPIHGADPKGGDEFGGQFEYLHFHGGRGVPPTVNAAGVAFGNPNGGGQPANLGKRNAVLAELGYYNKAAKLSVFGKFEGVFLDVPENPLGNIGQTNLFGGGLKYFMAEQLANLTLQYNLTQFRDGGSGPTSVSALRNSTSLVQLELQLAY